MTPQTNTAAELPLTSSEVRNRDGSLEAAGHVLAASGLTYTIGVEEPDGSTSHPTRTFTVTRKMADLLVASLQSRIYPDGRDRAALDRLADRGLIEYEGLGPRLSGRGKWVFDVKTTTLGIAVGGAIALHRRGQ